MKHLAKFMTGAPSRSACGLAHHRSPLSPEEARIPLRATTCSQTSPSHSPQAPGLRPSIRGENPGENPAESNDGFEPGKDYENNVNQIYVILAEKTESGEYLYVSKSLSNSILSQSSSKPTYTVQFNSEELSKYVDKNSDVAGIENYEGKSAYVFAYCNPTPALIASLNELGAESNSDRSFTDKDRGNNGRRQH